MTFIFSDVARPAEAHRHASGRLLGGALAAWLTGLDKAQALFTQAVAGRPQQALLPLAVAVAGAQPERAAVLLRRCPETNRGQVDRIDALCRQKRYSIATVMAENLSLHSPGAVCAPARLCRIRLESGDHAAARRMADDLVRRFPDAGQAWQMRAAVALAMDDGAGAAAAAARMAALLPGDYGGGDCEGDAAVLQLRLLVHAGALDEAWQRAATALMRAGDGPVGDEVTLWQARIARLRGDAPLALAALRGRVGHGPGTADLFAEMGDTCRDLGHHADALAQARRALAIDADHVQALRCLAHAAAADGRRAVAIDAFMRLLDLRPDDQDGLYGLEAVLDGGSLSPDEAGRGLDVMPAAPSAADTAQALWARGRALKALRRPREAAHLFEQVLTLDPGLEAAAVDLGGCLLDLGRPGQALRAFQRGGGAKGADQGMAAARALHDALHAPLPAAATAPDPSALVEGCAQALRLAGVLADPVSPELEGQVHVVNAFLHAGLRYRAEDLAATALALQPDHAQLRLQHVWCLMALERFPEAGAALGRLLDDGWDTTQVRQLTAICAQAGNEMATAETNLVAAMTRATHLADYPGLLGDLRLYRGDKTGALAAYREAVRRMPSFALAHQNYAARNDHARYAMSGLEPYLPDDVLLADGANRGGERRVYVGDTAGSNHLFAQAIAANRRLGRGFHLGGEITSALALPAATDIRILPHEWVIQIGHMAMLDTWLKIGALGWREPVRGVLLAPPERVVNRAYLDCWRPFFTVVEDPRLVARLVPLQRHLGECFNGWVGADGRPEAFTDVGARAHAAWGEQGRAPLLTLPADLRDRGRAALRALGMPADAWFVAMHVRDGGYHAEGAGSSQDHRNAAVDAYRRTIDAVIERGGWVVRLGDRSMRPLPARQGVIDYALSDVKSDWMDVFLCAAARCYLGTTSGLANVAISFGTPTVLVNCLSNYAQLWPDSVLFTWRPYWSRREGRYLSLAEILAEPVRGATFSGNLLKGLDLEPRDNDPDDIRAAVVEMLDGPAAGPPSPAVVRWRAAAAATCYFGGARPARLFAERTADLFFPACSFRGG